MVDKVAANGSDAMIAADWHLPSFPVRRVFAGYQHGCALRDDGTAFCWGRDTAGETQAPGGTFTSLALGEKLSCGLRPNGDVECWGGNPGGPWAGPFIALGVTTHMDHDNGVCAVRRDQTIVCWDYED